MVIRKQRVEYFIFGISILAFFLFLATSFNSFYWMDDFWIRYESLNHGVFPFQKEIYLNWDGRAISPLYTVRILFLYSFDYPYAWVVTMIGMLFLTGTGYFSNKLLYGKTWRTISINQRVIQVFLCSLILVMAFRPHLSRSLYWGTGVFYVMTNFFTVFTVYSLIHNPKKWWNFLVVVITCTSGPNNGLIIIWFLIFIKWIDWIDFPRKLWFFNFITGIISVFIAVVSPGNFNRSKNTFSWDLTSLSEGFLEISKEYLGMSLWVVLGGFLLGFCLDFSKSLKVDLKLTFIFFFASIVSILPFLPLPSAASKHTAIFFQAFLLLGIVFFIFYLRNKMEIKFGYYVRNIVLMFFLFFFIYQISIQLVTGSQVKEQIDKRFEILEANRGGTDVLTFHSISISPKNWVSRFWDIDKYPDCNCNNYYEKYFDTGKIIIE